MSPTKKKNEAGSIIVSTAKKKYLTCHPGDTAEDGRGAHHGVQARRDAVVASGALAREQPDLRVVVCQLFNT